MKRIVSIFIALVFLTNMTSAYTLKVTVDGIDLVVTREPGNVIRLNEKIAEIIGWDVKTGNVTIVDNEFVMPKEDVEIEAILYQEPNKYLLTVENMFARTREEKTEGQSVTAEATSYEGYNFLSWIATGLELTEEQKTSSAITFTMPSNEVTLEAIYEIITLSWDTTGQLTKTLKLKSTDTTIIDWGDGTKETYTASPEEEQSITHTYTAEQNYAVKIGGDNNITHFWCPSNQISTLDIDGASNLVFIDCGINNLTALNTSNNTELVDLWIGENQINSVDLSNNTKVEALYANQNNLSEIDVSKNLALKVFTCFTNNLSNLDVSKNTLLYELNFSENQITDIDLTNNTELIDLAFWTNQISSIDLSNNIKLTRLFVGNNKLKDLDVENHTQLVTFTCDSNELTTLDVSKNSLLSTLNCYQSSLVTLYLSSEQNNSLNIVNTNPSELITQNTIYIAETTAISVK